MEFFLDFNVAPKVLPMPSSGINGKKSSFSVLKNINIIKETIVIPPRIKYIIYQPSKGTTVIFKQTPSREAIPNATKNNAFILMPNL